MPDIGLIPLDSVTDCRKNGLFRDNPTRFFQTAMRCPIRSGLTGKTVGNDGDSQPAMTRTQSRHETLHPMQPAKHHGIFFAAKDRRK